MEEVFPSAPELPSNTLKFYIHFSAPMSRGEASRHIHWLDKSGKPTGLPFLIADELWDSEQQRLTLFFDPGRIKRGIDANEKFGPPIREGEEYTLVIDREFLAEVLPRVRRYYDRRGEKRPLEGVWHGASFESVWA